MRIAAATLVALVVMGAATAGPSAAAVPAWITYRHDALRSGVDPDSAAAVAPAQAWQTAPALDGQVFGSPLVYGSRVYVATENDSVYALSAATGSVIWRAHLGTPVPENSSTTGCGDVNPVGITGTPVIDPVTQRIFAVAETWNGSDPLSIQHLLLGFNLADGSVAPGLPTPVDPPGAKPRYLLQRPGLALDAGRVVFGFGGNGGDCGQYSGWVASIPEGGGALRTFQASPAGGGAVWGSGTGLPVDPAGAVWAETGNGFGGSFGLQESVLMLDPTMHLLDHWAPANWAALDSGDVDLGSSEPLLLPGGLVFAIGKEGTGALLNASRLGGTGAPPVFQAPVCSGGSFGSGIYVAGVIYVTCQGDGIHALALNLAARTFAPLPGWHVTAGAIGPPMFAGGLVWSAGWTNGILYGLQPGTGTVSFSTDLGGFNHFAAPSAGGGRLFVADGNKVTALTIATPPPPSATTTAVRPSAMQVLAGVRVTFTATVADAPDAGTMTFTDGATAIAGCAAVAMAPMRGSASCTTSYSRVGRHTIKARYSGDSYYLPSVSPPVTELVVAPPSLSRVRIATRGKSVTLRLTLSEPATVTAVVGRVTSGRLRHGRCSRRAPSGKRCTLSVHVATLHLPARAGTNAFKLRLAKLRAARYTVALTASDAGHRRSRRYAIGFRIR